jgi:hypothetical protein
MIDDRFTGRLLAGERIAWAGQPGRGLVFTTVDIFLVPFSLLWCSFAIFALAATMRTGRGPDVLTFMPLLFVCLGLYFVAGRFLVDAWFRSGIRYAVTDRRILIARPGPFSRFTAIGLAQLGDVNLSERASGRGTVRFGQAVSMWGNRGLGAWSPAFDPTPQFIAIDDARRVFDLIQQAIQRGA